jgi:hypothetical protein
LKLGFSGKDSIVGKNTFEDGGVHEVGTLIAVRCQSVSQEKATGSTPQAHVIRT